MANDSEYGLGGAVWTKDINRAFRVARAIETGACGSTTTTPAGSCPLRRLQKTGIGRETHKRKLEHYTQKKNIS
jgi:acyl-CoA reductase-like NAD-dependent aldehyde dehydrogenase